MNDMKRAVVKGRLSHHSWSDTIMRATSVINGWGRWESTKRDQAAINTRARRRRTASYRIQNPVLQSRWEFIADIHNQGWPIEMDSELRIFRVMKRGLTFKQAAEFFVLKAQYEMNPIFSSNLNPLLIHPYQCLPLHRPAKTTMPIKMWKAMQWTNRMNERGTRRMEEEGLRERIMDSADYQCMVDDCKSRLNFFKFSFGHVVLSTTWRFKWDSNKWKVHHQRSGVMRVYLNANLIAMCTVHSFTDNWGGMRGDWRRRCLLWAFRQAKINPPESFQEEYETLSSINKAMREVTK